jgi:hypothetical protein
MHLARRSVLVVVLLAVSSFSVSAQTGLGNIGPSGAQVAGAIAGVAAVTGVVLYLALHKPSITGCIRSVNGANSLLDTNDNIEYALVGANLDLKPGERVKLQGKKKKDKSDTRTFQVKKLKKDYGPCQP